MWRSSLYSLTLATVVALAAVPASAQETQDTGRYLLYQGAVETGETGAVPVLLDTQYGRTWMLVQEGGEYAWKRIPIIKLRPLPETLLSQPNPATRSANPAPGAK